jgi:N-ethylmaleimide reductase
MRTAGRAEATATAIGAERVGLRLSPGANIWQIEEENFPELYEALLRTLAPLGLAYVHMTATTDERILSRLRQIWTGTFMVNPSNLMENAATDKATGVHWLNKGAELISYGRAFLANPDLVERLRDNLLLTEADSSTFYQGGDKGYLDYTNYKR